MARPAAEIQMLEDKARACRRRVIQMTAQAGSGHPGPSLSAVDILAVLYFREMHYDASHPQLMERDRFVLSKGHAAPGLYAVLIEAGILSPADMAGFRQVDGLLQGHPCIATPGVDTTTGSLGLGLSAACGMAWGAKLRGSKARVYALIGDGESNEGQIWEAAMSAAHLGLDNLTVFTDRNGYQVDGPTHQVLELEPLADKWQAFGWAVWNTDGHDYRQILDALDDAHLLQGRPKMIIAQTVKGKGVSFMEGNNAFHQAAPTPEQAAQALEELGATEA